MNLLIGWVTIVPRWNDALILLDHLLDSKCKATLCNAGAEFHSAEGIIEIIGQSHKPHIEDKIFNQNCQLASPSGLQLSPFVRGAPCRELEGSPNWRTRRSVRRSKITEGVGERQWIKHNTNDGPLEALGFRLLLITTAHNKNANGSSCCCGSEQRGARSGRDRAAACPWGKNLLYTNLVLASHDRYKNEFHSWYLL